MSTRTPTIEEINDNIIAQLDLKLSTTIPLLPKSFSRVLAAALAAIFVIGYKYIGWVALQMFVTSAQFEPVVINGRTFSPLIVWGNIIGVGSPTPPTRFEFDASVVVTNQTGTLPAGSLLFKDTNGYVYSTISAVNLDAPTVTVRAQASSDGEGGLGYGAAGNLQVGDTLDFANPLPNVARTVTISEVLVTAADGETETSYRGRVEQRFARRPQGGARVDYQIWGEEVAGIDLVLPYSYQQPSMRLYSRATPTDDNLDGIPTQAQLDAIRQACLFDAEGRATRAQPNVDVTSLSHTRVPVVVNIVGLVADDETAVKNAIDEALDEYLRSLEPFILGVSILPIQDRITSAAIGGVIFQVMSALGATFVTYSVFLDSVLTQTYVLGEGELSKLDTVTYS